MDYCLVPIDAFTQFTNFKILDILVVAEEFSINLPSKIHDHSLLTWDLTVRTVMGNNVLYTHAPCSKHYDKIHNHFLESDIAKRSFKL